MKVGRAGYTRVVREGCLEEVTFELRFTMKGKLDTGHMGSLYHFLQLHMNLQLSQKVKNHSLLCEDLYT